MNIFKAGSECITRASRFCFDAEKNKPGIICTSPRESWPCTAISGPGTGPPKYTGWVLVQGPPPTSRHRSCTLLPMGRFTTTPSAPWSVCCTSRTTDLTKFGSIRFCEATRKCPASEAIKLFQMYSHAEVGNQKLPTAHGVCLLHWRRISHSRQLFRLAAEFFRLIL